MKLNAVKCAFEVNSKKLFGHLVTLHGIETNLEQIVDINDLVSPRTMKEVQKLTRMVVALNQFIRKSSEKCRPFFNYFAITKIFYGTRNVSSPSNSLRNT